MEERSDDITNCPGRVRSQTSYVFRTPAVHRWGVLEFLLQTGRSFKSFEMPPESTITPEDIVNFDFTVFTAYERYLTGSFMSDYIAYWETNYWRPFEPP